MTTDCRHWSPCRKVARRYGGCCALGLGQGAPSYGVCRACDKRESTAGAVTQMITVAGRVAHAAGSIAKTTVGIDRALPGEVEARLNVCRKCPGAHAIWKDGDVHTCGPMIASLTRAGHGTCGCVLKKKALDAAEHCPFGWW